MRSNHAYFFETDSSRAKQERRAQKSHNRHGNPINLKSTLNAVIIDIHKPTSCVFVACSDGCVRHVDITIQSDNNSPQSSISTNSSRPSVFRATKGHPLTCLALGGPSNSILFAGSWDRTIWAWESSTGKPLKQFKGHSDFVKAIACATLSKTHILISGGSDNKILVWDVATATILHTLSDVVLPMGAVQALVIDPTTVTLTNPDTIQFLSASSDPHIRRWQVSSSSAEQVMESDTLPTPGTTSSKHTLKVHETTVHKLVFDQRDVEMDLLYTASADGKALCLSRMHDFAVEETYVHASAVRTLALTDAWLITGGVDENINVWDRLTGELYVALQGHFSDVTDLVVLEEPHVDAGGTNDRVVSVSLDNTLRTWDLGRKELDAAKKRQEDEELNGHSSFSIADYNPTSGSCAKPAYGMLTPEEEAELCDT